MEARERDFLTAAARFLSDYCGEEVLRRWREKLPAAEWDRLAGPGNPVRDACRRLVEPVGQMLRALLDAVSGIVRAFLEAVASTWATISGRGTEFFGREAL